MSNLEFVREDYIVAVKMEFRKDVGNFLSNKSIEIYISYIGISTQHKFVTKRWF